MYKKERKKERIEGNKERKIGKAKERKSPVSFFGLVFRTVTTEEKSTLESYAVKIAQTSSAPTSQQNGFPLHITSISLSQALLLTPDLTLQARRTFTDIRYDLCHVRICYATSVESSNDINPV